MIITSRDISRIPDLFALQETVRIARPWSPIPAIIDMMIMGVLLTIRRAENMSAILRNVIILAAINP
jgi:hypothetical protein